jgi:hypothetical protein
MAQDKEGLQVRIPPEIINQIDNWRRKQPVMPARAAAVRYFLEKGMSLVQQEPKKGRN